MSRDSWQTSRARFVARLVLRLDCPVAWAVDSANSSDCCGDFLRPIESVLLGWVGQVVPPTFRSRISSPHRLPNFLVALFSRSRTRPVELIQAISIRPWARQLLLFRIRNTRQQFLSFGYGALLTKLLLTTAV